MGKVVGFLSSNFRGRMYKSYVVNSPSSVYYIYNLVVSKFINVD